MVAPTCAGPTAAEAVRSCLQRHTEAMLAVDGQCAREVAAHFLLPAGRPDAGTSMILLARSGWDRTTGGARPAVLELTDDCPLELNERVRALVWMRGRVGTVPAEQVRPTLAQLADLRPDHRLLDVGDGLELLRLDLDSVVVADGGGAEAVTPAALAAAGPDPFWREEPIWLRHLDAHRPDLLARMARRLPARPRGAAVRPLSIDRYGIRLRFESADGDTDMRLPFDHPVDDVQGLSRALRVLIGCPFLNGLRAS